MLQSSFVPLNQLAVWSGNVRKTGVDDRITEMAASIRAHGLLQPLRVRPGQGGMEVVTGQRRLLAIRLLADEGHFSADEPIACVEMDADSNATEVSLAENVMRADMHLVDQFRAFRDLAQHGMSVAEIALRFGASELMVQRLLKLGRVSPGILEAFRDGELKLDQVQAFAITDSIEQQEALWESIQANTASKSPQSIRQALTATEIPVSDPRVRFIGLEAYEAAGGEVRRDLFDTQNSGTLTQPEILTRLVSERFEETVARLKAEGWSWAEARPEIIQDWHISREFEESDPVDVGLSEEAQARLAALQAELDAIETGEDDDEEQQAATLERIETLEAEMSVLEDSALVWTDEAKAVTGALVHLDGNGQMVIRCGLGRPDEEEAGELADDEGRQTTGDKPDKPKGLSALLVRDLTMHRTAAMRAEMVSKPQVAMAALAHSLALRVCYPYGTAESCLTLSVQLDCLRDIQDSSTAPKQMETLAGEWKLPENPAELWNWCVAQPVETLTRFLAFLTAHAIMDVRDVKMPNHVREGHADRLANALGLDMRSWYATTADSYFSRITRNQLLEAWPELAGKPAGEQELKLKKKDLAVRAEREIAGKGWLPELLRTAASQA